MVELALGLRVVRGPNWDLQWGDQDGGEGFVGTVVGLEEGGDAVIVQWDMGQRCRYRCGYDNMFDLRVLDSGPSGCSISTIVCHVCRKRRLYGVVWRCLHCSEYYLCSSCYLADHHCLLHRCAYLLSKEGTHFRVPCRAESRRIPAKGLFVGAVVVRGVDWRWKDQDGGKGSTGTVVEVTGWSKQDSTSENSVVEVVWQNGNRNKYRAGHKGKVDLLCTSPASEVFYYPEHLPILGRHLESPPASDLVSGDRVQCDVDVELLTSLKDNPTMAEKISLMLDHVGTVNSLLENGDLLVRYPSNALLPVNTQAAKKVDIPGFECGDVVRMISDMAEAYRLQQGHGEWNDDMALCLDQVGTIVKSVGDGSVMVSISGYRWVLNPCCLRHAPGEELSPETNASRKLPVSSLSLLNLADTFGPSILVHATSSGDTATVQAFLEKNPHQVNTMEQGKTAVHVAVEENRLKILEVLLTFKPNLSQMDGDGDTPLHTCAYHNAVQAASLLLEAGADVNARNGKRSITPIMIAGAVGHFTLLEVMASHHTANVNIQDMQGQTALHHSLASQRTRAIPILLTAGADLTLLNANLFSPLLEAAGFGFLPGVEDLVRWRPDLKDMARPSDSITALHLASARDRLHVVRHLALSGCDLNQRNDHQRTALQITAIEGHSAIMECLVGYGVDINARDSDGNTVMHVMFVNKNARPLSQHTPQMNKVHDELDRLPLGSVPTFLVVACFLVQEGADLSLRNNRGQTPVGACPADKRDVLLNYVNKSKSNRGEFHGSLKSDITATSIENTSKTGDNRASVVDRPPLATSSHASVSVIPHRQKIGTLAILQDKLREMVNETPTSGGQSSSSGRSSASIMQPQPNYVGIGGGRRGHRERDRLKLLQVEGKSPTAVADQSLTSDKEPQTLNAKEREHIRKQREAYFGSHDQKRRMEASVPVQREDSVILPTARSQEDQSASNTIKGIRRQDHALVSKGKNVQSRVLGGTRDKCTGQIQKSLDVNPGKYEHTGNPMVRGKEDGLKSKEKIHKGQNEGSVKQVKDGHLQTETLSLSRSSTFQHHAANEAGLCFVCEIPADARFIPCGHVVACKRCAGRAKRCPICKVLVGGVA